MNEISKEFTKKIDNRKIFFERNQKPLSRRDLKTSDLFILTRKDKFSILSNSTNITLSKAEYTYRLKLKFHIQLSKYLSKYAAPRLLIKS